MLEKWNNRNAVVSYWISTSNHNGCSATARVQRLYLIEFLHQTTTDFEHACTNTGLYLIEFLHQTTTRTGAIWTCRGCILLNFYIKPQQRVRHVIGHSVVSYWISTSNHNCSSRLSWATSVVSYWISTSNHNGTGSALADALLYLIEFLHQTTTPPWAWARQVSLYLIEFLHQTTTIVVRCLSIRRLYLIEFLHQTTTSTLRESTSSSCILLNFYIKPQPRPSPPVCLIVVSYWISTSNHNRVVRRPIGGTVVSYWISTSNHNFSAK